MNVLNRPIVIEQRSFDIVNLKFNKERKLTIEVITS